MITGTLPVAAEDRGWATLTVENNNLGEDQDRYYVNGFNLAYLSAPVTPQRGWVARATDGVESSLTPLFAAQGLHDRRYEWTALGQQIFTPANKSLSELQPHDRPYAGWLYTGLNLLQDDNGRRLDNLQVTLGLVGPDALGRQVQNGFHKIFGFGNANGWSHQLRDEPALTLGYARKWRFAAPLASAGGLGADVVPELGAVVGNVFTYGEASALLRLGWGLDAGYGPRVLQPGATGGGYFNPERVSRPWGIYAFGGWQGRAVGRDIFLDGNTYRNSASIPKYPWQHDFIAGVSMFGWRSVRVDWYFIRRSEEFHGQAAPESYGGATVSIRW